ncbi:MAG TPA: hypothetical protein VNL69_02100, partial [Bacteroidota bacterium]|nr:hypothetical protein [Bacteroidota bacterium]
MHILHSIRILRCQFVWTSRKGWGALRARRTALAGGSDLGFGEETNDVPFWNDVQAGSLDPDQSHHRAGESLRQRRARQAMPHLVEWDMQFFVTACVRSYRRPGIERQRFCIAMRDLDEQTAREVQEKHPPSM